MRSSKHQTSASTDTRSLATAFIGGFRRLCESVCTKCDVRTLRLIPAFALRKECAVGVRAARASERGGSHQCITLTTRRRRERLMPKMYAKLEHYRSTT